MIVGRAKEQSILEGVLKSEDSEFVVLHGRRRVGKTYLVREYFSAKECCFMHVTGVHKGLLKTQLSKFIEELSQTFFWGAPMSVPRTWDEAFSLLTEQIKKNNGQKIVVFLDELPWLATRRSNLLQSIDYYWNRHWSTLANFKLVVCGSSASWMINNIINDKGGLHNRATREIRLLPFKLHETKEYLHYRNIKLTDKHILAIYMALGGIPYYLNYLEKGLTAEQNIQKILFDDNAPLRQEFHKLFHSLFNNAESYIEIIRLLAKNKSGVGRSNLKDMAKLSVGGGRLSDRLLNLQKAGFIQEYIPWGSKKGEYYKVIDEFCLFYLRWVDENVNKKFMRNHWLNQSREQSYKSWAGYSFETVCFKHIDQIVDALDIKAAGTIDSWRYIPKNNSDNGAQIDLLIDRSDDAITICEIKYTDSEFVIDKQYSNILENKISVFKARTKTHKQVFLSLICANGVKKNKYYDTLVTNFVTSADLFRF